MITYTVIIQDAGSDCAAVEIKVDSKDVKPSEEKLACHFAGAFKAVVKHNSGSKISGPSHPNN